VKAPPILAPGCLCGLLTQWVLGSWSLASVSTSSWQTQVPQRQRLAHQVSACFLPAGHSLICCRLQWVRRLWALLPTVSCCRNAFFGLVPELLRVCAVAFAPSQPAANLARADSSAGTKKKQMLVRRHSSGDHAFLPSRQETAAKNLAARGGVQPGHMQDSEVGRAASLASRVGLGRWAGASPLRVSCHFDRASASQTRTSDAAMGKPVPNSVAPTGRPRQAERAWMFNQYCVAATGVSVL